MRFRSVGSLQQVDCKPRGRKRSDTGGCRVECFAGSNPAVPRVPRNRSYRGGYSRPNLIRCALPPARDEPGILMITPHDPESVSQTLSEARRTLARGQALLAHAQWALSRSPDVQELRDLVQHLPPQLRQLLQSSAGRLDREQVTVAMRQAWQSIQGRIPLVSRAAHPPVAAQLPGLRSALSPRRGTCLL